LPAVLLVAVRFVAEADLVVAERRTLPRVDDEDFFVEARFFRLRGFSVLPATVSTNAVTALFAVSIAAFTFALAASAIASCADVLSPSFSLSIVASLSSV
jgi:hypothetical protein